MIGPLQIRTIQYQHNRDSKKTCNKDSEFYSSIEGEIVGKSAFSDTNLISFYISIFPTFFPSKNQG